MTSTRPIVKRQYGSKKFQASTSSSSPSSSSTSSAFPSSSAATTRVRAPLLESGWQPQRSRVADNDDDEVTVDTPPTSSSPLKSPRRETRVDVQENAPVPSTSTAIGPSAKRKEPPKKDLFSFFKKVSPTKKIKLATVKAEKGKEVKSLFGTIRSTSTTNEKEQLYLDPFETLGHSTVYCKACELSYSRTLDDSKFHDKYHKKVLNGIEWLASSVELSLIQDRKIRVLENNFIGFRFMLIDLLPISKNSGVWKKLKEVMQTIDRQLGATELSSEQLLDPGTKMMIVLNDKKKVVAATVVQRIKEAMQIVLDPKSKSESKMEFSTGDDDDGAIFCDPKPVPTLLGIHRIWTCSTHRRQRLAYQMLDYIAESFIYGAPIDPHRRSLDIAFSQPTGKGQALAKKWTGTAAFKVFVD